MLSPADLPEKKDKKRLLIIDHDGAFATALARFLSPEWRVAVMTTRSPLPQSLVTIPFRKKFFRSLPSIHHLLIIDSVDKKWRSEYLKAAATAYSKNVGVTYLGSIYSLNNQVIQRLRKVNPLIQIMLTGDVLDEQFQLPNYATSLLSQAVNTNYVTLQQSGLLPLYISWIADIAAAIFQHLQTKPSQSDTFFLFAQAPLTELSFARYLKKHLPLLVIDFSKKKVNHRKVTDLPHGIYEFPATQFATTLHETTLLRTRLAPFHTQKQSKFALIQRGVLFTFLFILLPPLSGLLLVLLSAVCSLVTTVAIQQQHLSSAVISSEISARSMGLAGQVWSQTQSLLAPLIPLVWQVQIDQRLQHFVIQSDLSTRQAIFSQAKMLLQEQQVPSDALLQLIAVANAQAVSQQQMSAGAQSDLSLSSVLSAFSYPVRELLPELSGLQNKQTYLVCFEDETQLRPGGGQIAAYGLLTLTPHHVTFTSFDPATPVSKAAGDFTVPYPLSRYAKKKQVTIADSFSDLDPQKNLNRLQLLTYLQTKSSVTGVIQIDTQAIKKLLEKTGPITPLSASFSLNANEYPQTLMDKTHHLFPTTSTDDKTTAFYTAFAKQLFTAFLQQPQVFEQTFPQLVQQKHLSVTLSNQKVQSLLFPLSPATASAATSIDGFLAIRETSLSAGGVPPTLRRLIEQHVDLAANGKINGKIVLRYENTNAPVGKEKAYDMYMTIWLPDATQVTDISLNGVSQTIKSAITNPALYTATTFTPPPGLEVEEIEENQQKKYGWYLSLPEESVETIVISYEQQVPVLYTHPSLNYIVHLDKQPGTGEDHVQFELTYPDVVTPIKVPKGVTQKKGSLGFSLPFEHDLVLPLSFGENMLLSAH